MNLKTIDDLGPLSGKRVLLRLDYNVPVSGGVVAEGFRIDSAMETISLLRAKGAKIGIVSHIENEEGATLVPVFEYLKKRIPLTFVLHLEELAQALSDGAPGSVTLMENIRQYEGEKKNDHAFSEKLAAVADVYVNDAFSVCHRAHSSVVGVTYLLPSAAGPLLVREITELSKAFEAPRPFLFVLGGAKFDTKLPLVSKFLNKADMIFIGGALGNDLLKARGLPVGASKLSKTAVDLSAVASAKNVIAPVDVIVKGPDGTVTKMADDVAAEDAIMDVGPQTTALLAGHLKEAKFVVWNGPLGYFEGGFSSGTETFASTLAHASTGGAYSIVGGGDTLSAIAGIDVTGRFSFVSTGGGAMLDYLGSGTLPALEVLKK